MRRALFLLTIALHGYTAMDLQQWVRVPQMVLHLLEHHGHQHPGDAHLDHGHADAAGHNPFGHDQHDACGSCNWVSLPMDASDAAWPMTAGIALSVPADRATYLSDHPGSKWNPPKGV